MEMTQMYRQAKHSAHTSENEPCVCTFPQVPYLEPFLVCTKAMSSTSFHELLCGTKWTQISVRYIILWETWGFVSFFFPCIYWPSTKAIRWGDGTQKGEGKEKMARERKNEEEGKQERQGQDETLHNITSEKQKISNTKCTVRPL